MRGVVAYVRIPQDGAAVAMDNSARAIGRRAHGNLTATALTLALLHYLGKIRLPGPLTPS